MNCKKVALYYNADRSQARQTGRQTDKSVGRQWGRNWPHLAAALKTNVTITYRDSKLGEKLTF